MHKLRWQRGDTIVEVLIAIVVASSVLGVTYSTMNRNLLITRDAQERTEASKIAQGQLELLKAAVDRAEPSVLSGTFCLDSGSSTARTGFAAAPTAGLPDNFANYGPLCRNIGLGGLYNVAVTANAGFYKVYVRWVGVQANGQQAQVVMAYRL